MSTDLRSINPDYATGILQNQWVNWYIMLHTCILLWYIIREVIAIDQDPMGVQGRLVANVSQFTSILLYFIYFITG